MKRLTALLLLLPVLVSADPQPWMKKTNPNELYSWVRVGSTCSTTSEKLERIVHGVLVRSRIKPTTDFGELILLVDVQCGSKAVGIGSTFTVYADFVRKVEVGDELYTARMGLLPFNGGFGIENESGIESYVRLIVEDVITDYLKANFDLGEDE